MKLNPHTAFVIEVEDVIGVHYASLTSQGVQHRVFYLDGHPSRYQPRATWLNFGEQTATCVFPFGDSRKFICRECFRRPPNRKQIISRYEQDANG